MDNQTLEAINYIRKVSKKKVTIDKIITYLNNAAASNWDKKSVEANLKEMQTKGIINENYKPLITEEHAVIGNSIIKNANRKDVSPGYSVKFDLILGHQRRT